MRLILIRHAESESNRRDFQFFVDVWRGRKSTREAELERSKVAAALEPSGDTSLSDNGLQQAECLGEYWAPLFERLVRDGKPGGLHFFVSPMQRTMQTLEPLVHKLSASTGVQVRAMCWRDLYEIPGIVHPADREFFNHCRQLVESDKAKEAAALFRRRKEGEGFTGAGLSPAEILRRFGGWVMLDEKLAGQEQSRGWFTNGPESDRAVVRRMARLATWLEKLRDELPLMDTVVLVGHGQQLNHMLNLIFARAYGAASDDSAGRRVAMSPLPVNLPPGSNTSVSSLRLDPASREGERPKLELEFFHRVDHLGPETEPDTLMRGYRHMGFLKMSREDPVGYWGLRAPKARL